MKKVFICMLALLLALAMIPMTTIQTAAAEDSGVEKAQLNGIDIERRTNYLVAYTAKGNTNTPDGGIEALVGADGIVISVGGNNNAVPDGGFVISGSSTKRAWIEKNIKPGYLVILDKESNTVIAAASDYNPFTTVTLAYTGVNSIRAENTCIIYKNKATTETNTWGFEVVVNADGLITSVGGNNNAIPTGGFVISAIGTYKQPLTDAARVGMTASYDTKTKKITIEFGKQGAVLKAEMLADSYKAQLENARDQFRVINYDRIEELIDELENCADDIAGAINANKMAEYAYAGYLFDGICAELDILLPEIPAVEGRVLWLRPLQFSENTIKDTVKQIYDFGFNSVCIELLYDNTTICRLPEGSLFERNPKCGKLDILKLWIDEFHRYGMEVHGWMSTFRVCHSASGYQSAGVANKKPEWRIIGSDGRDYLLSGSIKHYYLNPAIKEVRELLVSTYRFILENYDLDGFQLDYIRYPDGHAQGVTYGYDETTCSLFKAQYGVDPKTLNSSSARWKDWISFKANIITNFVIEVADMAAEVRPDVYISAAVAPQYDETYVYMHQDTKNWLQNEVIDIAFPMSYGTTDAFKKWTGITLGLGGDNVVAYMGMRDGGAVAVKEQILAARELGADGTAFFSYSQYIVNDYVGDIENTVYRTRSVCPTYNAGAALTAQLKRMLTRYNDVVVPALGDKLGSEMKTIQQLSASGDPDFAEVTEALDALTEKAKGCGSQELIAAIAFDRARADRIIANSRDEARAEYQKTHPLPELYDLPAEGDESSAPDASSQAGEPSQTEPSQAGESSQSEPSQASESSQTETSQSDTSSQGEAVSEPESSEASAVDVSGTSDDSSEPDLLGDTDGFDRTMQMVMIAVVCFAAFALPLFFILDIRRKRIAARNAENDADSENNDSNNDNKGE